MKQHITEKQINELSETELNKLYYFTGSLEDDGIKLLSIGEMIEFLLDCEKDSRYKKNPQPISFYQKRYFIDGYESQWWKIVPDELCDDLWEAVKEALKEL